MAGSGCRRRPRVSPAHAGIDHTDRLQTRIDRCLPRPRGDRPRRRGVISACDMSPPPTRGSTAFQARDRLCSGVSPAHAGIDPAAWRAHSVLPCLPRPRGDRPTRKPPKQTAAWSPPPTRGSTLCRRCSPEGGVVSPAHAGIDLGALPVFVHALGLPRPRGDRPVTGSIVAGEHSSPPPTRGSTCRGPGQRLPRSVSPAHAGIDPRHSGRELAGCCLPRPRGDRPARSHGAGEGAASPPPTRGSTGLQHPRGRRAGVSPAHAGIDPQEPTCPPTHPRLPRPRGDRPKGAESTPACRTSPPPTRGSTQNRMGILQRFYVSPAHAGIDRARRASGGLAGSLPRPRGDRPINRWRALCPLLSPPPTRGSTLRGRCSRTAPHVSPAHAGIDPGRVVFALLAPCLPRPRGYRPYPETPLGQRVRSPPPTRGSTPAGQAGVRCA